MKRLLLLAVTMSLLLAACGTQPAATEAPTLVKKEPAAPTLVPATRAAILPTPTPVAPPPTPTPLPTNTPVPTNTPLPAVDAEDAEETAEPTPSPTAIPAVTDVMAEIPGGPFKMGSDSFNPDEGPPHEVDVPTFQMDKFEVTNADFASFVEASGYQTDAERNSASRIWHDEYGAGEDNHPVVRVTWNDGVAYCTWLGKRLPTEAEWEKAARGPRGFTYPWGNEWDPAKANVKDSGLRGTSAVGSYPPNGYGLFDMAGNAWEWTGDWYQPYPGNVTADKFYGEQFRVIRGGGWYDETSQLVTYNRNAADPKTTANDDLGFRCAK